MPATAQHIHVGQIDTLAHAGGDLDKPDSHPGGEVGTTTYHNPSGEHGSTGIESPGFEGPNLDEDPSRNLTTFSHTIEPGGGTPLAGTGETEPSKTSSEDEEPSDSATTSDQAVEPGDDPEQDDSEAETLTVRPVIGGYEVDELALAFPAMGDEDFQLLKKSIAAIGGLLEPITIFKNRILDGFHRARACEELGITPRYVEWIGPGTPWNYVLARNLHRRHLNESQRAMLAARISNTAKGRRSKNAQIQAITQDEAAKSLDVSRSSVQDARKVVDQGIAELVEAVETKKISVSVAAKIAKQPKSSQPKALEAAKRKKKRKPRARAAKPASFDAKQETPETPPPCPEVAARTVEITEPDHRDPVEEPTIIAEVPRVEPQDLVEVPFPSSKLLRFAEACCWINKNLTDVLEEISKNPYNPALISLETDLRRATAALFKVADSVKNARSVGSS